MAWLLARFSSAVPQVIAIGIGVSSPAPDAYDYFGLTPDKVVARITEFMKQRGI